MTFYQELQLSQAGSKNYIASLKSPKQKAAHIAVYLFKIILNLAFCIAFVTAFGIIFGSGNTIAGLVVLLGILVFRFSDLGIKATHSVIAVIIIFIIFAVCPKIANLVPCGWSFCINFVSILFILLLGCHNAKLYNHTTLVLSYLLLTCYDVSGRAYALRVIGLAAGAVTVAAVLYHNHRKNSYGEGFCDLFKSFSLSDARTRWQLRFALCISAAMLIATLTQLVKPVWAGIAASSVLTPDREKIAYRAKYRILGNVCGSAAFLALYLLLPENVRGYIGIIGGIGLGLSVAYGWQTVFNGISALAVAAGALGLQNAVLFRIFNNVCGAAFAIVCDRLLEPLLLLLAKLQSIILSKMRKNRTQ